MLANIFVYILAFAVFCCPALSNSSDDVCNGVAKEFKEKEEMAESQFLTGMNSLTGGSGASEADLYSSLTSNLNVSQSIDTFDNFTKALEQITDSYFKACFGPDDERPTISDTPAIKKELLSLLRSYSDIETIRTDWGKLTCLGNFETGSQSEADFPCELAPDIETFYKCLDPENISCIFHLNSGCHFDSGEETTAKRRHCLGFAVDTTGSMSNEINATKQVVLSFLQSEEDISTLCYVLIPFNDYDFPIQNATKNLEYMKVYDSHYLSSDPTTTPEVSLVDVENDTVYGVNDLVKDVNALYAHGGGDCPEFGMIAISKIIDLINSVRSSEVDVQQEKHNIIVLTDASAKDDSLYLEVIDKAIESDITVHFFFSGGGCSSAMFENYTTVANGTNGITVSQIDGSSFSLFVNYIQYTQDKEAVDINPIASKKRSAEGDCTQFSISLFAKSFSTLFKTTHSTVNITKPDLTTESLDVFGSSFTVYNVENPLPGVWKACVQTGTLTQSLSVSEEIEIQINYVLEDINGETLPTSNFPKKCDKIKVVIDSDDLEKYALKESLYLNLLLINDTIYSREKIIACSRSTFFTEIVSSSLPVRYQIQGIDLNGIPFKTIILDDYVTYEGEPVSVSVAQSEVSDYYGASVNVQCYSTGNPQPTVNWYKNGTLISFDELISADQCSKNTTKVLSIPLLTEDNDGVYTCIGTNTLPNGTVTSRTETFTLMGMSRGAGGDLALRQSTIVSFIVCFFLCCLFINVL